jgi:RNA polymerase sigma-70 factor (ECF subfamily)
MRDEDADQLPALLDQFLSQLEEPEWQLFCGRYWHGHSVKELARTHGLTPKAVTMRLFRTREKLRLFLTERGYHV